MYQYLFGSTALTYLFSVNTFVGTWRNDYVFSSALNDTITTGDGNDYVDSGAGNDILSLGNGNDIAFAGNGDDQVDGGAGNDEIYGGNGNDNLNGGSGNDYIDGGAGNDIIRAGDGDDRVDAGAGNDSVIYRANAGSGNDRVNGGQGTDTLVLELTAAQQQSAAFLADKAAFTTYLANGGNGNFQFNSIGLRVTGGFEQLNIVTIGGPPVNTAPVVSGPVTLSAGTEDTAFTLTAAQLLANATDAEGNPLSVVNLQATNGTLVNNGNGTWTFTPAANFNGQVNLSYGVSDGSLTTAATATVTLAAVNDGPVAGALVVLPALAEDTSVTLTAAQLLQNATDIDSASLSVVNLQASSGTLVNHGNGTWTYTPALNDNSGVTFTYQISDGTATVAGTASMDLTPVNDGPVAGAPIVLAALAEDTSTTITTAQLLANASDVDGDTLSVTNLQASSGTLVNNGNGTWTYTPALNDNSGVTFTYQISDGTATVAAAASLDLTPVNDAPVAGAPIALPAVNEDTPVTITAAQLLGNATDVDADTLTIRNLEASSGTITLNGDGSYTFTPDLNDDTAVTFTYEIFDGTVAVDGTASLELLPVNDLPVIEESSDLNVEIFRGGTANGTIVATDVETPRSELTYELYYGNEVIPQGSVFLDVDGSYVYEPPLGEGVEAGPSNFVGEDSFQVLVRDGEGGETIVTVSINVVVDPTYRNYVYGNGNDEAFPLQGTADRDVFVFENFNANESASGNDVITEFTQGRDIIRLDGESYSVDDILEGVVTDPVTGNYVYSISETGAEISTATLLTVADFERNIWGSQADDELLGSSGVDTLTGYAGNDALTGGAGADTFAFYVDQPGDDRITDFVSGQDKVMIYSDSSDIDAAAFIASGVVNADGTVLYQIGPGTSILVNAPLAIGDVQFVNGGGASFEISATAGDDANFTGTFFSDNLFGLAGNDTIFGLSGADRIDSGSGDDVMTGGTGSDTFIISQNGSHDTITDFDIGQDYIALDSPTNVADFLQSVQVSGSNYTYSLADGTSVTTTVALNDWNVYNLFPV
jgi:Cadherin-like domain/RTX calcium-binding nonapeptide repeat (4 copies)